MRLERLLFRGKENGIYDNELFTPTWLENAVRVFSWLKTAYCICGRKDSYATLSILLRPIFAFDAKLFSLEKCYFDLFLTQTFCNSALKVSRWLWWVNKQMLFGSRFINTICATMEKSLYAKCSFNRLHHMSSKTTSEVRTMCYKLIS